MDILINESLKAYIDPLTPDEYEALEASILTEGCRDALVLWGSVLIDGHNRYSICREHDLPFQTVQNTRFQSMDDVHLWMIDQHLGRRSVSDFQRGVLALRKREILAERRVRAEEMRAQAEAAPEPETTAEAAESTESTDQDGMPPWSNDAPAGTTVFDSREALAKAARLSSNQVGLIEKIQKQATPEVVAAVKSGTISINAAAAVATLPAEEQRAAAMAGGDELKQAAKRARESKRKPREPKANGSASAADAEELQALRQRVEELTLENESLRREIAELQAALA
jgi:hypothetical protein